MVLREFIQVGLIAQALKKRRADDPCRRGQANAAGGRAPQGLPLLVSAA
ncbi:hypothetical protein DEDE109153_18225 [Deinococcus deserti]